MKEPRAFKAMSVHALPDRRPGGAPPSSRAPDSDGSSPSALSRGALVTDFLAMAALDPEVEAVRAPAAAATFVVGPFELEHVADFELTRDGRRMLVDVATDAELARHPLRTALVAGPVQATDGRVFTVETARTLRAEPRFSTVRLIGSCRRVPSAPATGSASSTISTRRARRRWLRWRGPRRPLTASPPCWRSPARGS
jgi:hypothetical protein